MNVYKLRCDLEVATSNEIVSYISKVSTRYCYVVEKIDTNPHLHFYLEGQPTRYHLRKMCGSGNKGYSLKEIEKNPIEYLAYMMKEGEVTWVNMPQKVIDEATVYQAKVKAEMLERKQAKKPVWKKIIEDMELDDKGLVKDTDGNLVYPTPSFVSQKVLEYHIEKELLIRKFQIIAYIDTICCHICPSYDILFLRNLV